MPRPSKTILAINELKVREVIMAVEELGSIRKACESVDIHRRSLDHMLKIRPDLMAELKAAQERGKAKLLDRLEAIAIERAENGSDILLMFMIKKLDPSYRESYHVTTSSAPTTYTIDLGLPDDTPQLKDAQSGEILDG